jgi:hypothetical protein
MVLSLHQAPLVYRYIQSQYIYTYTYIHTCILTFGHSTYSILLLLLSTSITTTSETVTT